MWLLLLERKRRRDLIVSSFEYFYFYCTGGLYWDSTMLIGSYDSTVQRTVLQKYYYSSTERTVHKTIFGCSLFSLCCGS